MREVLARFLDFLLCRLTIFITGIKPSEGFAAIDKTPKIYYANHTSHGDFLLLWVSLPYEARRYVRPVAGADYWQGGAVRKFLAKNVFNMLLIDRQNPRDFIAQATNALSTHSLIIFPEGTRKVSDDLVLQPFKSGIYRLAKANPKLKFTPIWIHNIKNVLPKGFFVPIPLLCDICVGESVGFEGEEKAEFIAKTQNALLALRKERHHE